MQSPSTQQQNIKIKDKEQRKEYLDKIMNDETLLKAAMWLFVVEYRTKILTEIRKRESDCDKQFKNLTKLSDSYVIDIINNPELYDTEVKPVLLKMCDLIDAGADFDCFNKQLKILNRDDLIGSFKEFMKNRRLRSVKGLKLNILEQIYRAWAKVNNLEIEAENDFRSDEEIFNRF